MDYAELIVHTTTAGSDAVSDVLMEAANSATSNISFQWHSRDQKISDKLRSTGGSRKVPFSCITDYSCDRISLGF